MFGAPASPYFASGKNISHHVDIVIEAPKGEAARVVSWQRWTADLDIRGAGLTPRVGNRQGCEAHLDMWCDPSTSLRASSLTSWVSGSAVMYE